ncbi:transposase, partial [Streptomyces sp. DSM 40712]
LDGPIVVVWDNLNTHLATGLKRYEADHDWLTTVRLPPYAPDLRRHPLSERDRLVWAGWV